MPVNEPLDTHIPAARSPSGCTIIAADGSQINPDPHGEVLFALVNVGLFTVQPGSNAAPRTETRSSLLYDDTLHTPNGLVSEDLIALLRDVREREILAEVTKNYPRPSSPSPTARSNSITSRARTNNSRRSSSIICVRWMNFRSMK